MQKITELILKQASCVIFVGDHTKFDNPALYKIADIDRLDAIVTDTRPGEEWHRACRENEIKLIYPDGSNE
jgi:DeoR/GlpR family transcriptional regulator of sugar metabolism